MEPGPARAPLAALLCLLPVLLAGGCASPPEPDPFDSTRMVIQMGGMRLVDGLPAVQVALKNKTPDTVWVLARFRAPAGGDDCEQTERIEPEASAVFSCRQQQLLYDEVYDVAFDVFADEARTELLEQQSTELLFGSEFRFLLEAARRAREEEQQAGE
jgi:hypothetical protein